MHKAIQFRAYFALLALLISGSVFAQPISVEVANEAAINTDQLEFSPTFYTDGIVFISSRSAGLKKRKDSNIKMQTFSILQSKRSEAGTLQTGTPFSGVITTTFHEGPVCFNAAGDQIYFSSNINKKKKKGKKAKDGKVKMKIYTSTKTGDTWSEPIELPFNAEGQWDVCHPALSIEGDRLIFASDQPGGNGKMDLYVSYRVGETWAEPINLGNKINSSGNDLFPFLHADNTLYFSSDAKGKGGLDLFYSVMQGADYVAPINIGQPFNTAGDDFGLILDLNKINGYYTSNGNGGAGADDVFSLHTSNGNFDEYLLTQGRAPNKQIETSIVVEDDASGKVIPNAEVKLVKLDQGTIIGRDSVGNAIALQVIDGKEVLAAVDNTPTFTDMTDATGRVVPEVAVGSYAIIVSKIGYKSQQVPVRLVNSGSEHIVKLDLAGNLTRFNTVLFDENTNAPLAGAMIIMKNQTTGESETVYTDENGALDYHLASDTDFKMEIYQGSKLVGESSLKAADIAAGSTGKRTTLNVETGLKPGSVIELPNIYYNFNDATLRPDARKDLDPLVAILNQYPKMRIQINSYTDSRGSANENKSLSEARAKSVQAYLVKSGISAKRLQVKGFGETMLRNKCADGIECEEKDHSKNRRTELQILGVPDSMQVAYREGNLGTGMPGKTGSVGAVNTASGFDGEGNGGLKFKSGTKFYLVAGSFLMQTRATNRMQELLKAGYSNVSIVQFPKSPFYSVCVDKLDTYEAATQLKSEFAGKMTMDSFVRPE
jgi:outer membrane protein OmpA-like peptidoglycan-associated protein